MNKIRGNVIGTPISPEKSLIKATHLTPDEQAQIRRNIGAAAVGEGGSGSVNENYVIITDQSTRKRYKIYVNGGKLMMEESEV